jgi:ABC-2 type transport system permease protein
MDAPLRYLRVLATFARNSLIRDMTFRANFIIDAISSISWVAMNVGFYLLVFQFTPSIGAGTGWEQWPFFAFLATGLLINSIVHALFMTNADELSELVRTGNLDFALLKPIDTQFLVSFTRVDWSAMGNFFVGLVLLGTALWRMQHMPGPIECILYPVYIACGVAIYYSLMIAMAATSVWLGRNLSLLDFWFYITNFSRYPMEIYRGTFGNPLRAAFTWIVPVLVVVNVPARLMVQPVRPQSSDDWLLAAFALVATVGSLAFSRWIFVLALGSYRSASS